MLSPCDPRLRGCVAMHTQTHGTVYLKVNRTNESGFDRVAKNGNKWRAWINVDSKQKFLKPSQEKPEEAALQLYLHEHPEPTLRSPSPGHHQQCKRAPAKPRTLIPFIPSLTSLPVESHDLSGMKMHQPVGSPLRFTTESEKNEQSVILPNYSQAKFKVDSPVVDFTTVKGQRVPVCKGEVIPTPIPGVQWLSPTPLS